jgi:hypothetical protein
MKTIQATFQVILFITSLLALSLIGYQLATETYPTYNLVAILVFTLPVLLSFILSGSLLIKK